MKKNSYRKSRRFNFKPLTIAILSLIILVIFLKAALQFLKNSDFFQIKKITYPKVVQIPSYSDIFDLMGRNLFSVNIKEVSEKVKKNFPQLTQVRLLRHLPDELIIEAQKRKPLALVKLSDKYFSVDSDCVIISESNRTQDNNLPLILGIMSRPISLRIGQIYDDSNLKFGLEIIQEIDKISYLKNFALSKVDVSNLSRTLFAFTNGIEVIIGEENISERLKLLAVVISRLSNELDKIKYIDLRFKEPAIGRK